MAITLDATLPAIESLAEVYALTHTSHTLADTVLDEVQDASYTYADVLELFNDCLMELAGEYFLPGLEVWRDVSTDPTVNHTRMPADYMRRLRYAHSITYNREIKVWGSLSQLYRWFSNLDQTGPVIGLAPQGRVLYYQRVPSAAEVIRINYYRFPRRLESRADKPDCLPWHLAKKLLKHYACREIFSQIEDGQEGKKTNTLYHDGRFTKAKEQLEAFIGPEEHPPVEIETEIDWEAYA